MSKTIIVPDGIITLSESKAKCPHCGRNISFDEIEPKFMKSDGHFRMKCKCKRFIGITQNMMGDFVAYELNVDK